MHHHTIFTSILVSLILIVTQITAQKCLLYNTLSLPVVYHDVCVRGTCMNANTFMPDFDLPRFPKTNDPSDGYRYSPRTINGYQQNFCAAITPSPTDLSLRPTGCNSADCSDSACTFDSITGLSRGLVQSTLGADGFPRWRNNKAEGRKSIASETTFNKWYYDSTATIRIESELNLTRKGHTQTFQYEEPNFFPLDGRGYWSFDDKQEDQNRKLRNFGFTTAIISEFVYTGGENFTFRGDDDVWVFIDNQLAIDIGGLHSPECRAIILDEAANSGVGKVYTCTTVESTVNAGNARAGETYTISGLTIGSRHTLSIFHAERHEEGSSFAMSTSIGFNAGDIGGLDYTLPSATGARIYIGTYQFIRLGRVDSAPDPIQLPIYAGTPQNTAITITLEFPPTDQTQIICRILQLNSTIITAMQLNDVDRNTIPSPLDVTAVKAAANQATWASVITEADHVQTSCTNNEKDQPSWTITVRTTGGGSGYLYCIADAPGVSYSDYTAAGRARDTNFYRKWVATSITSLAPTTLPPTTLPPTTEPPTTLPPTTEPPSTLPPTTEAPTTLPPVITTQPPTTAAPTDAPTTAAPTPTPTPTDASTTLSPTTLPPTTTTPTPTDAATTAPPTTPTPTESSTTQPPTTTPTPTTTTTPTVTSAPTTTSAPNTDAPTNAITTAPPTSTPTPTPTATPAPTNAITTSPPTSTSTPTPTMTIAPTDTPTPFVNPTDAPTPTSTPSSSSSTGIAVSSAASNGSSDIIQLQYVVPVAVAGVIVIVALVWGSIVCWKRRKNNVFRTHGSHMEMV